MRHFSHSPVHFYFFGLQLRSSTVKYRGLLIRQTCVSISVISSRVEGTAVNNGTARANQH